MKAVSLQAIGLTVLCSVVSAQSDDAAWGSVVTVGEGFTYKQGLHRGMITCANCSVYIAKSALAVAAIKDSSAYRRSSSGALSGCSAHQELPGPAASAHQRHVSRRAADVCCWLLGGLDDSWSHQVGHSQAPSW